MCDRRPTDTRFRALRRLGVLAALALVIPVLAIGARPSFGADPVTITMARNADMLTFDPYSTEDDPSIFVELQIFDRLVKLNAANNGVEPELATSWTVAPDGLSATFTLPPRREVLRRLAPDRGGRGVLAHAGDRSRRGRGASSSPRSSR